MDTQFIQCTLADVDTLLTLMREYYAYDRHEFIEPKLRDALTSLLTNPAYGYAWLIADGGTPVGYMAVCFGFSLEFGGRDAFLDEIYLREAYRGKGIGRQAILHMLETCRANGIRALHLEVMPGNRAVIAFYEKLGFENRGSSLMTQIMQA
jgi:ribosomal protein S18 acetylase RimI-like enzyme